MFSRISALAALFSFALLSGAVAAQAQDDDDDDDDGTVIIENGEISGSAPDRTSTIVIEIDRGDSAFPQTQLPLSQLPQSLVLQSQLPQSTLFGVER